MKHLPAALAAVALALLAPASTRAASVLVGSGLTVSPIIQNISAQPGETVAATIKVSNPTDQTVTSYPLSLDFRSDGSTGKPLFYKAASGSDRFSLSAWFTPDQTQLTLQPQQTTEFGYHLHVPLGAEAGGHYGGALFADTAGAVGKGGVAVDVKSMVGTLLFLRVAGDIQESARLVSFLADRTFSFSPRIALSYDIKNAGNIHLAPYGEINVKNWRGQTVDTQKVNPEIGTILPDSSRLFTTHWTGTRWSLGYYTADLAAFYGTTNQPLGSSLSFLIVPLWLIIAVLAFLLLCYLLLRFRPRINIQVAPAKSSRKR